MILDPRHNLAATAAGILGLGLYAALWIYAPEEPFAPVRLALPVAGFASLIAGAWPSRGVRLLILLVVVPAFAIVGVLALFSVGIPILLIAAVAACALLVDYAREGRT